MEKIQQALIHWFVTAFASWVPSQVAWENRSFTPPRGKPWMAFFFMPVDERVVTLGPTGYDQADGLLQIDVNYPLGVGEGESRQTINDLRACFTPGTIEFQDHGVTVLSRSRSHGREKNGYYCIPFTVRWKSELTRNEA